MPPKTAFCDLRVGKRDAWRLLGRCRWRLRFGAWCLVCRRVVGPGQAGAARRCTTTNRA